MWKISKEAYQKIEVEIIDKGRHFWINRREKYRQELIPNVTFQRCRVFVRNDLVERKKAVE